jgi:hypothetical protein
MIDPLEDCHDPEKSTSSMALEEPWKSIINTVKSY